MTLYDLLPSLQKVSSASGGEWAGACPWCGGKDRFRIWPNHPSGSAGGRFYCRQCGKTGDALDFLRERDGLTYPDACKALGISPVLVRQEERYRGNTAAARKESVWMPRPDRRPSEAWRKHGEAFLARCSRYIESGPGREALEARCISPGVARRFRIGWNPSTCWENSTVWGLEEEIHPDTGKPRNVCLPAGLVVPVFRKDGLLRLKIRRADAVEAERFGKWQAVKGGGDGPQAIGTPGMPVIVCEAEIDALYVAQEAGKDVVVVGLGSAANRPTEPVVELLRTAPLVLVALDRDAGGTDHVPWWLEHFPRAVRWGAVNAKSPGDMDPESLRLWVAAGLSFLPGKEGQSFEVRECEVKGRTTSFVRNGVWLRDTPPFTPLDTLRCWGLPPRLEAGALVSDGWDAQDEPTRAGIERWLEHAAHRERVVELLQQEDR